MNTFCSLPWIHLATHPDGGVTLCCISDHTNAMSRSKNIDPLEYKNLNNDSIQDIMNSDYFKKTRLEMLNGEIPEACKRCFAEEKNGIRSKRIEENEKFLFSDDLARAITSDDGAIPVNFKFVELRLGNLCNLKCRTCNPVSSTQWIKPHNEMKKDLSFVTNYETKINSNWTENDEFWQDLFEHSNDLELIYINGGEPTLVEKHWVYLEELIRRGYNKQITLWYNINMTQVPDKLIDLWKQFKKVQLTCSIDDLYERNDYIRTGSSWSIIESNLEKVRKIPWLNTSICQTVSWLNVYYVDDFVGYMNDKGLHTHLNFVYDPKFLSVQVLPNVLKNKVLEKSKNLNDWQLNSIASQFTSEDKSDLFAKGIQYNNWLDKKSCSNFQDIFPDWFKILNEQVESFTKS